MAKIWDPDVLSKLSFWRAVVAECLATLLYVFVVCASFLHWYSYGVGVQEVLLAAFTAGFSYAILVHCFEHVSGGHVNPATTLGMLFSARIGVFQAVIFIVFQCGGGIGGAAVLFAMSPESVRGYLGATRLDEEVTEVQGFAMEFMITFLLVFTVFATFDAKRNLTGIRGLPVGLAVIVGNLIGLGFTGASMNPARTLGPAIVMGIYDGIWVYMAGPLAGGIVAGWLYVLTFGRKLGTPAPKTTRQRRPAVEMNAMKTEATPATATNHTKAENIYSEAPATFSEMESQTPDDMNEETNTTVF